jgi:hypothetical protein
MTPEGIKFIKEEWIPALRSGEYKQGNSYLHRSNDSFCCLGVACKLLVDKINLQVFEDSAQGVYYYNHSSGTLPKTVLEFLGLSVESDSMKSELECSLINMNDIHGASFNKIADYLEEFVAKQ